MSTTFDDVLALQTRDFRMTRVLVLCGESGSGKSSAIRFLLRHRHFADDARVRVIEELRGWRDLRVFFAALKSGHRLLVASHLPIWLHRILGLLATTELIALDRYPEKIRRWLDARNIVYSEPAIAAFCARFGANYTDAALILDHADAATFDQALYRFNRQCRLEHQGFSAGLPVLSLSPVEAEAHYQSLNDAGIKQVAS